MEIEKNTVPAENQLPKQEEITFAGEPEAEVKIAFVGNSITRHAPSEELGWHGDWGMAASGEEKDYVHRVLAGLRDRGWRASACICNASRWEKCCGEGFDLRRYEAVREYEPDYLILRLVENCPAEGFCGQRFERAYEELVDYLRGEHTRVILTTGFWKHPGDKVILEIAKRRGYPVAYLGELGEQERMKAVGRFTHTGVAAHPGDLGMEQIAEELLGLMMAEAREEQNEDSDL